MNRIFLPLVIVALLSGCSANRIWYGSDKPRLSWVTLEGHPAGNNGNPSNVEGKQGELVKKDESKKAILKSPQTAKGDTKILLNVTQDGESSPGKDVVHLGTIISWSPEFNAAYITDDGKGCIQPATYARLGSGNLSLPSELLGGSAGKLEAAYSQALEKLSKISDQSTFLSIGFYGLCQLQANGGLTDAQVEKLGLKLMEFAISAPPSKESSSQAQDKDKTNQPAEVVRVKGSDKSDAKTP